VASANHATASAAGNSAINLVSADGAAFDASVAAGNQQANDSTTIRASANGVTVGAQAGHAGTPGTVTVSESSIGASARSNTAQTIVDVRGTNFAAGSAAPVEASGGIGSDDLSLDTGIAGIAVGNLQANFGEGIATVARVEDANLGAFFDYDRDNYGAVEGNARNNTVATVTGNALSATAGGNSAMTSARAGGTSGSLTASVVSGQYNANDIEAVVDQTAGGMLGIADNGYPMVWGRTDLGVALTVSGNTTNASATANQAANHLDADFDNTLTLAGGGTGGVTSLASSVNDASAALVLVNDQVDDAGDVTSTVDGARTGVDISRSEFASYTVSDNTIGSSTTGNTATTRLTAAAGTLSRAGSGTMASLGNRQVMQTADSIASSQNVSIGSV